MLGIIGAIVGSWVGGFNPGPLPDNTEALRMAREILPGVNPPGELDRRDYVYGSRLGDEEWGPGYVEIPYEPDDGGTGTGEPDCSLDRLARTNAVRQGWEGLRDVTELRCSGWVAQRGDVVIAYTHDTQGPVVTFYRSTTGATVGALIGALAGVLAGVAVCRPLSRRPLVLIAVLALPGLVLLPVTALALVVAFVGHEGPVPELWTYWPILARLFFFYSPWWPHPGPSW
ncbi:hypothetical protein [Actinoplanes regularis]|uniref:hypothetical protein n=1 Tax=Actinoplanes regularis TaxID=52697 RepID=UPI0024A3A95C|nr:hypothetical protein [Actinoplanes regularis]GLW32532.1 hypothetical protein Areg01_54700 [Actinoplanes regularis]